MTQKTTITLCFVTSVAMALSGCAWFGSERPAPRRELTDQAAAARLNACQAQANAVMQRDTDIQQDITGSHALSDSYNGMSDSTLQANMAQYSYNLRRQRLIDRCLAGEPVSSQ